MALSRTLKEHTSGGNWGSPLSSFSFTAFTPTANSLLVVLVGVVNANDSSLTENLTISGGGLTWTKITSGNPGAIYESGTVGWRAEVGGSPSSTTITVSRGSAAIGSYSAAVWECTGYNTSSPVGGKIAVTSNTIVNGALTATLDATPASDSYVFGLGHLDGDSSGTFGMTEGSGYTEVGDLSGTTYAICAAIQERTGSTSTAAGWADVQSGTGATYSSSAIAVEIKAAAGGGGDPEGRLVGGKLVGGGLLVSGVLA